MAYKQKSIKILPENLDGWKIDGYEFTKENALNVLKESVEENSGNFYHISIEELEKTVEKIIQDEREIMFFPVNNEIDSIITNLKNIKVYNLYEMSSEKDLKNILKNVKIGITGADAIAAETGSIIICDYSSLKSYAAFLPEKHIVVSYKNSVFPTILDALKNVWLNAEDLPSTIQIIQGPSKTGDIEKKIVRPSHGPKELHLIILEE